MNIGEVISDRGLEAIGRYYSKYRAIVVENKDPDDLGKLAVIVPQIGMNNSVWAYPCINDGTTKAGFKWLTPKIGAIIYVEFQMGDPLYPLWSYHGWAKGEKPNELKGLDNIGFVTPHGHMVVLNDITGELTISLKDPENEKKEVTNIHANNGEFTLDTTDDIVIKGSKIHMMGAQVGTTLTDKLLIKLNLLETELNTLKAALATSSATAALLPILVPTYVPLAAWSALPPLVLTKMIDIENKEILQ